MTVKKPSINAIDLKTLVAEDRALMKSLMKEALQEVLEAEVTDFLGAGPHERQEGRQGYRAGHYERGLVARTGKLELRVPWDRSGQFQTALFERYQRSEKAFVAALAEMYVQGVSTRKVKAITEELCGPEFLGLQHQRPQQGARRGPHGLCRAASGRAVSLPDSRCPLREGP